jgi:alpha-glucosidase
MKKLIFPVLVLLLVSCNRHPKIITVSSPDHKIKISFSLIKGKPYYEVRAENQIIIKQSSFGFEFQKQAELNDSFCIEGLEKTSFDEVWKPACGTDSMIRNHYNEASINLKETAGKKRSLMFTMRAYNDGVAFRYEFPDNKLNDSLFITAENTEFNFAANDSAWWIPANEFAYESLYRNTPLSKIHDANTPLTIQPKTGYFLALHEAALIDYSEMTLKKSKTDTISFISSLWPEPDGVCARVKAPFKTPWRCIIIGKSPGELAESHLIQNLNEPCKIKDISWIKPLKFIGIWWGMHTKNYTWYKGLQHGATTERMKKYIDFAAAHHIEGVLAEGWNIGWETWASGVKPVQDFCKAYPDFDFEEVVRYAKEKNVEFISHHETGGNIPEYEKQMDSAFALCQKLGIHYLKTGYAGPIIPEGYHHHGQFMVRHFQKVVETAAKHKISLDVHESIKPTGLDRTWPNLLTQEGARGNEWNATYKATPPYHSVILPFTRFLAGPFDYTPGIFNIIHSPETNKRLYCTLTYQLAQLVVFYSPMMMVSDMIENYENQSAFKFVEEVPCSWDKTSVITAKLGDYVTIARKSGGKWFIGTIADENCYLIKIPLSFLDKGKNYIAEIYCDSNTTSWEKNPQAIEISKYTVCQKDTIYAAVSKAGGHCVILRPCGESIVKPLPQIARNNNAATEKIKVFQKLKTYGDINISHLAVNKTAFLENQYSELYPASGKNALTDGVRGNYNFSAGGWQGFEGENLIATIDLQKIKKVNSISVGFLSSVNDWIFFPYKVEFFYSEDGKKFIKAGESYHQVNKKTDKNDIIETKDFSVKLNNSVIRYIRVKAYSIITCPQWHQGNGKKAWLFCDEIIAE